MTVARLIPITDEGLGNTSYLVQLGDDRALAVDASRDVRALQASAAQHGLQVAYAADTHLHADFLSGARQLAATHGTTVVASAAGNRTFGHTGLYDGDELDLGGLRLRALGTPGHTHEHLSFLLLDGAEPIGVFTGGSLLVGAVARTDLVDPARTEELARAQYRSVHRLLELPDEVEVWPTHGAGSFCAAPPGTQRSTTIGAERATNPLLQTADEDSFVTALLGSLGSFPTYFARLAEANRRGPTVLGQRLCVASLEPAATVAAQAAGAQILDVRAAAVFASDHPTGALSIPLRPAFASWLGWLVPHDRALVVLRELDQDLDEVLWQAAKIGYENIVGEIAGGLDAWVAEGLPTNSVDLCEATQSDAAQVLDVRQAAEFRSGHVPGALNIELGDLPAQLDRLSDVPTVIMCGRGDRAMGAASLLASNGFTNLQVLVGGAQDWAAVNGQRLESGP